MLPSCGHFLELFFHRNEFSKPWDELSNSLEKKQKYGFAAFNYFIPEEIFLAKLYVAEGTELVEHT